MAADTDGLRIETTRLVLRRMRPGDVAPLEAVLSDAIAMRYYPAPFDRAKVQSWVANSIARDEERGYALWSSVLKETGEVIGDCGFMLQDIDGEKELEIGYHTRRDLWGRGLATEAARACRDYGFDRLGRERIISLIRPENAPSQRVALKNGMRIWKDVLFRDIPHHVFAIRRGEPRPSPGQAGRE
jgi:RimJ/RimL family protein N-acetyltransferase